MFDLVVGAGMPVGQGRIRTGMAIRCQHGTGRSAQNERQDRQGGQELFEFVHKGLQLANRSLVHQVMTGE